jgi:hypothetical protein
VIDFDKDRASDRELNGERERTGVAVHEYAFCSSRIKVESEQENRLSDPIEKQEPFKAADIAIAIIALEPHGWEEISRKLFAKLYDRITIPAR